MNVDAEKLQELFDKRVELAIRRGTHGERNGYVWAAALMRDLRNHDPDDVVNDALERTEHEIELLSDKE